MWTFFLAGSFGHAVQVSFLEMAAREPVRRECVLDASYPTGERLICGNRHPYLEVLHTFGDPNGSAVEHGALKPDGSKPRAFYRCRFSERARRITKADCRQVPSPRENIPEDEFSSPIVGSAKGMLVANAHEVGSGGLIFRSMAPRTSEELENLKNNDIRTVLIFKSQNKREVDEERTKLTKLGIAAHHIPFLWRDFGDFSKPCEHTIQALRLLLEAKTGNRKALFHCTVGEDRTGYLAAIFRLLTGEHASAKELFFEEMCERGYDLGDAYKPYFNVTLKIRESVTRLYLQMAERIRQGKLTPTHLDEKVCLEEPVPVADKIEDFKCKTSTRFRPNRF